MDTYLKSLEFATLKTPDLSLAKSDVEISVTELPSTPESELSEDASLQTQPANKNTAMDLLQRAAWKAVTSSSNSYTVQGVTIQNIGAIPVHETKPLDLTSEIPPESFILTGQIALFDNKEWVADFYSYLGPPPYEPAGIDDSPMYHMAVLRRELSLSILFPNLVGTPFDAIAIQNPSLVYQNMPIDTAKIVGCTLEGRVDFDQSGVIHDMLSKVLGFERPSLSISGGVATQFSWKAAPELTGFQLEGVFADAAPPKPPCQMITLSRLGARIIGFNSIKMAQDKEQSSIAFGFELFGGMNLQVPGCHLPLDLDFKLQEIGGSVSLSASLAGEWENPFGISNLKIQEVCFGATDINLDAAFDTLHLTMSAAFYAGPVAVRFQGHYSTSGDYGLSATTRDFSLQSLSHLYYHFFKQHLNLPDIDIEIGEVTISIEKEKFGLIIHDLKIGDYACSEGLVTISREGIEVKAKYASETLTIHDIQIKNVSFEFNLDRSDSKEPKASVMMKGEAEWQGHGLAVGAHVYQNPEPGKNLEFTVVAAFKAASETGGLPITTLIPKLKSTFMEDVVLQGIALTAASRNDAEFGSLNQANYRVKKGIRVCAQFGQVQQLETVSGGTDSSLIFYAGWNGEKGFDITLSFPEMTNWQLGPNITTDTLELSLVLGTEPKIEVKSGIKIPIDGQEDDPLHFSFFLDIGPLNASATGALQTEKGWKNPFNLCPELIIGPDVALSVGIDYATFVSKGPSRVAFVGGASIGKKSVQFAFVYDDNISKSLLSTTIKEIGLQELVQSANDLFKIDLPLVPDVLYFELLKIYICPGGTDVGPLHYPPGFTFSSKVLIFGIQAKLMCSISSEGLIANGAMDNFTLGPNNLLAVRGVTGDKALYDFEITKSKQSGVINGVITLSDVEVSLMANFQLLPTPTFDFHFQLTFDELFNFDVQGHPMQPVTSESSNVLGQDWKLDAVFTSEMRDHVSTRVNSMFLEKAKQAQKDAELAKAHAEAEHKKWQDNIDANDAAVKAASQKWLAERSNAQDESDRKNKEYEEHTKIVAELKAEATSTAEALKQQLGDAARLVAEANSEKDRKCKAAEQSLDQAQKDCKLAVEIATKAFNNKLQAFNQAFPNLQATLDDLGRQINTCNAQIDEKTRELARLPVNIPGPEEAWNMVRDFFSNPQVENPAHVNAARELWDLQQKKLGLEKDSLAIKIILDGQNYLNDKKTLASVRSRIDEAESYHDKLVAVALAEKQKVDQETNAAVRIASENEQKIKDTVNGTFYIASIAAEKAWNEAEQKTEPLRQAAAKASADAKTVVKGLDLLAAEAALNTARVVSPVFLAGVEVGVDICTEFSRRRLELCRQAVLCATDFCNITDVKLTCQLGKLVGEAAFNADVKGNITIQGQSQAFDFQLAYEVHGQEFVEKVYNEVTGWAKTTEEIFADVGYAQIARGILGCPDFNKLEEID